MCQELLWRTMGEQNSTWTKHSTPSCLATLPKAGSCYLGRSTASWDTQSVGMLLSEICCQKGVSSGLPGECVQSWFYLIFPLATWMMEGNACLWNLLTAPRQDGWQVACGMGSEFKIIFMHWNGRRLDRGEGGRGRGKEGEAERERGKSKALHLKKGKNVSKYKMEPLA